MAALWVLVLSGDVGPESPIWLVLAAQVGRSENTLARVREMGRTGRNGQMIDSEG